MTVSPTNETFVERAEELKTPDVTPVEGNFSSAFTKRYNELVTSNVQGLFDRREGFENDSTFKTIIRNAIQFPKGLYTRLAPLIQFWAKAENRQGIDESLEIVEDARRRGLIDDEKANSLSNTIRKSYEFVVPDQAAIEQKIEETTGIPIQSGSRFGDLVGLAGAVTGFSPSVGAGASTAQRIGPGAAGVVRGGIAGLLSRGFENTGLSPTTSDILGSFFSQFKIPQDNGLLEGFDINTRTGRPSASSQVGSAPSTASASTSASTASNGDGIFNILRNVGKYPEPEFQPYTSMTPYETGDLILRNIPEPELPESPTIYMPDSTPSPTAPTAPILEPLPTVTAPEIRNIPELPEKPTTKAEIILNNEVGSIVSPTKFTNSTTGGKQIMQLFKKITDEKYSLVNRYYQQSKAANKGIEDIRPQLSRDLNRVANNLTEAPVPAQIEKDILQIIRSLKQAIGDEVSGYRPISNQALIDQIQSINRKNQSELILGNAKNIYRVLINAIERELERSATNNPQAIAALQKARDARRQWGEIYDNDTVFRLKDPSNKQYSDTYNYLLNSDRLPILRRAFADSKNGQNFINRLERDYVQRLMQPFSKGRGTNTIEYRIALQELVPLIGQDKVNQIDRIYKEQDRIRRAYEREKAKTERQIEKTRARNIRETTRYRQERAARAEAIEKRRSQKETFAEEVKEYKSKLKTWKENQSEAKRLSNEAKKEYVDKLKEIELAQPYRGMTREQIYNSASTITGLKKLEKALVNNKKLYQDIARQHAYDILSGNAYGRVALDETGAAKKALRTSSEREYLNYVLGKKNAQNLEKILANTNKILELVSSNKKPSIQIVHGFKIIYRLVKAAHDYYKKLSNERKAYVLRNVQGLKTIQDLPELLKNDELLQKAADALD